LAFPQSLRLRKQGRLRHQPDSFGRLTSTFNHTRTRSLARQPVPAAGKLAAL